MPAIQTALLSFGMSGKLFHAPFLTAHPGFHLTTIWERSTKLAADNYPGIRSVDRLEEVLADPALELVVVNTPTATHFEYAQQALRAGKHVLIEKAFTITTREAEALSLLANEQQLCLSIFQNRRYDSDFRTVQRVVNEGLLGELLEAEIHFDRFRESLSPKQHKELPIAGAGLLYDLGPHLIDQALVLFGFPEAVFADVRSLRPGTQVDDYFEILLYYPTLRVRLKAGYHYREPIPAYTLFGRKGSFHKSRADVQERDLLAGLSPADPNWGLEPEAEQGLLHTETAAGSIREKVPTERGNYMDYFDAMYRYIREGAQSPVAGREGEQTMRIIETARQSAAEQQVITLP
jgi:predicted dehydrogenase